jgi:hypothetical protein
MQPIEPWNKGNRNRKKTELQLWFSPVRFFSSLMNRTFKHYVSLSESVLCQVTSRCVSFFRRLNFGLQEHHTMHQSQTSDMLLLSQVHDQVESLFGQHPCLWQI